MAATIEALSDIPSTEQTLGCYSGLYSARARVLEPADVEDLRRIFAYASEAGRKVTFRAGGHSFDGQALGDDLVVSMMNLHSIEVLAGEDKVRVGPGATWGAILARLEPHGLVPGITVTTENATAGGTLSGDCLSRFSPAYGKEGESIASFELLTPTGEQLICSPPADWEAPPSTWTREERVFCGVIGGLGYLGAVVSITYCVLRVGDPGGQIGVRTIVRKFETFEKLAEDLVPTAARMRAEADPRDPEKLDAIWSGLDTRGDGTQSALFFTSAFDKTSERRRMPLHQPGLAFRVIVEFLMRVPFISKLLWRFYFRFLFRDREVYIDDLEGYTFFMDGNARAKRIGHRLGFAMRNVQQTFVVPSDPSSTGGWDSAKEDLVEWLDYAHNFLLERDLTPTLNDVLFLPKDYPFALSASADLPGFACSYAFETSNEDTLQRAKAAFTELADVLWERFQGRVYLVKNVFASKETLGLMYGDHAVEFFRLKQELDPGGILRNDFLERTFGHLAEGDSRSSS